MAAAAGAPGSPPANNVHRVQLDFKPSMNDELELRAGQLVRMLHEYDDGWVRGLLDFASSIANIYIRRFALVLTSRNKVSFLALVSQNTP
jgi:hypothetical protein